MLKRRLFNVFVASELVIVGSLTVHEAFATASITSLKDATITCDSLPSRYSIHTESVNEKGTQLTYTEDGPTGIDGGLIYLLSTYRTCSQ